MPDFLLIKVINSIDQQIGLLDITNPSLKEIVEPLITLRNSVLEQFVTKSSKKNWLIQDSQALKVLESMNWVPVFICKDNL
jgi:hypothetical protein